MRIALGLSYAGSHYYGWQYQRDNLPTVQHTLQQALSKIAATPVAVVCAGRTDAGVHALAQVVHFDTDVLRPEIAWVFGTNTHLPADIRVQWACEVAPHFHARFSATQRAYRYIIYNHRVASALLPKQLTWYRLPLDEARMQTAANYLIGEHDFTSYRAQECQAKTPTRTISALEIVRQGQFIILEIKANAFLHHMVRNIAGVLMAIGAHKHEPLWAKEVLDARTRSHAGVMASAHGLYLMDVTYPAEFNLPTLRETQFWQA